RRRGGRCGLCRPVAFQQSVPPNRRGPSGGVSTPDEAGGGRRLRRTTGGGRTKKPPSRSTAVGACGGVKGRRSARGATALEEGDAQDRETADCCVGGGFGDGVNIQHVGLACAHKEVVPENGGPGAEGGEGECVDAA